MTGAQPSRRGRPPREPGPDIPGEPGPDVPGGPGPDIPGREGPDLARDRVASEVPAEPGPEIPEEPLGAEVPGPEQLSPDVEEMVRPRREGPATEGEPQPTDDLRPESTMVEYEAPDEPSPVTRDRPTPSEERRGETLEERLDQERPEGPNGP